MTILSNAVPPPNLAGAEVADLILAADHLEIAERILVNMGGSLEAAIRQENAWLQENMTEKEREVLHGGDFEAVAYIFHGDDHPPKKFARMLHTLARRCRPEVFADVDARLRSPARLHCDCEVCSALRKAPGAEGGER